MRIIAGAAKGRKLAGPGTQSTRPATDMVREAVFSMVGTWVESADVVDLYAGTGSFGLEALSRGSATAIFVENGAKPLAALRRNVESVGLGGRIVDRSVQDFLRSSEETFDLAFVDPPWPMTPESLQADLIALDRLLRPNAEIIVSRRHGDDAPTVPSSWRVATDRSYGDTRILRYEKEDKDK